MNERGGCSNAVVFARTLALVEAVRCSSVFLFFGVFFFLLCLRSPTPSTSLCTFVSSFLFEREYPNDKTLLFRSSRHYTPSLLFLLLLRFTRRRSLGDRAGVVRQIRPSRGGTRILGLQQERDQVRYRIDEVLSEGQTLPICLCTPCHAFVSANSMLKIIFLACVFLRLLYLHGSCCLLLPTFVSEVSFHSILFYNYLNRIVEPQVRLQGALRGGQSRSGSEHGVLPQQHLHQGHPARVLRAKQVRCNDCTNWRAKEAATL